VVLWEPKYFTRLWCVYELAAFIHINDGDCRRVKFVPLKLSVFAIFLSLFWSIWTLAVCFVPAWTLSHPRHVEWMAEAIPEAAQYMYLLLVCVGLGFFVYITISPPLWAFCKWYMKDLKELFHQVRSFEFEGAECSEESDREFVREQIKRWFGDVAQFEQYVRTAVAEHVEEIFHEQGQVPYNVLAVCSLSKFLLAFSFVFYAFQDGNPRYVNRCIGYLNSFLFGDKIAMRLILCLAANGPSRLGWLSGSLASAMVLSIWCAVNAALAASAAPLWLAILLTALQLAVTCSLYCPSSALRAIFPAAPQESDAPVVA
jgi:hypothetical protein